MYIVMQVKLQLQLETKLLDDFSLLTPLHFLSTAKKPAMNETVNNYVSHH